MAQIGKLETKAEIKSSADRFYGFFRNNMSELVHILPNYFKSVQLVQGKDNCVGSVKLWKYTRESGIVVLEKIKMDAIDEGSRSITYRYVEGDVMQLYKSITFTLVATKGFAKWIFEYEKAHEGAPTPDHYADFAQRVTKGLDAYLLTH